MECYVCARALEISPKQWVQHYGMHNVLGELKAPIKCPVVDCSDVFYTFDTFRRHMKEKHPKVPAATVVHPNPSSVNADNWGYYECQASTSTAPDVPGDPEEEPVAPSSGVAPATSSSLLKLLGDLGANPTVSETTLGTVFTAIPNIVVEETAKLWPPGAQLHLEGFLKQRKSIEERLKPYASKYGRQSILNQHHLLIRPETCVAGSRLVLTEGRKGRRFANSVTATEYDTYQYFRMSETLKRVVSNPAFMKLLKSSSRHQRQVVDDGIVLRSCWDGALVDQLRTSYPDDFILTEIYYDDIQAANPLGSKAPFYKLAQVYFTIRNLPLYISNAMSNIFLLAVGHSGDLKGAAMDKLLHRIVAELKRLEEDGITVPLGDGTFKNFKVLNLGFRGDNLGMHQLFGFKEGFTAHRFCRMCLATKEDLQNKFHVSEFNVRTPQHHEDVCKECHDPNVSREFGVNRRSALNDLPNFSVVENWSVDAMHDLLEGFAQLEICLVLRQLIFVEKLFSADYLNDQIVHFCYGVQDKNVIPSPIPVDRIRNGGDLKQNASQTWCLLRLLPLMVGDKVPENNVFWRHFLGLCELCEHFFAPVMVTSVCALWEHLVSQHLTNFVALFPDDRLTPKSHFLVHYGQAARQLGPIYFLMTLTYEAKHSYFKRITNTMGCFKNVPLTVAYRYQRFFAAVLLGMDSSMTDQMPGRVVFKTRSDFSDSQKIWVDNIQNESVEQELFVEVTYKLENRGTKYFAGDYVILDVDQNCDPVFGKVAAFLRKDNKWLILCDVCVVSKYLHHYRVYSISDTHSCLLIHPSDLPFHHPINAYALKTGGELCLKLRHTLCKRTPPHRALTIIKDDRNIAQPVIVKIEGGEGDADYFVLLDREMLKVDGGVVKALELLLEAFYVFHVHYPGAVLYVYKFLDHIFGLGYFTMNYGPLKLAIEHIDGHVVPVVEAVAALEPEDEASG